MEKLLTLDNNYSTTRLLSRREPEIVNEPEDKVKTMLFLPPHPERNGEGGLRTKGYFKYSYEIENGQWYACDFRGRRLFEVKPPDRFEIDQEEFKAKDGVVRLPLVSIITVVLNGEKYLEETIKSVINQTYPNVEYIIIDGGSTDGTVDIIKKYENYIDYWVSESDKGIYDAMNKGIDVILGEWVNFMNAGDTLASEEVLKKVFFTITKKCLLIYGNTNVYEENGTFITTLKALKFTKSNLNKFATRTVCHQSVFVHKCVVKKYDYILVDHI